MKAIFDAAIRATMHAKLTSSEQEPDKNIDPIYLNYINKTDRQFANSRDPEVLLSYLWDRMNDTKKRLEMIDTARFSATDFSEIDECKRILGGYVVGVVEMINDIENQATLTFDVRDMIEDLSQEIYQSCRCIMSPPAGIVRI